MQAGAVLAVDALRRGDGGRVIVWSEQATRFEGSASVRGGALGGDGGLVEVSSKGGLDYRGSADRSAPRGRPGHLLLDPLNLEIGITTDLDGSAPANDDLVNATLLFADQPGASSKISASRMATLLAGGAVQLQASNDISVLAAISTGVAATGSLTLQAGRHLLISAPITLDGAGQALTLASNANAEPANGAGAVTINSALNINSVLTVSNSVAGSGKHVFNAPITAGRLDVTGGILLAGSNAWTLGLDSTISAVIEDAGALVGGLVKAGAATLTLSGANRYSGATLLSAGVLAAALSGSLPSGSAVTVGGGAALSLGASQTIASLAGAGSVALGAHALRLGGDGSSTTFSGLLTGSAASSLRKLGGGSLVLSGASLGFDGSIQVHAGTLQAGSNGALGTALGSTTVASGAVLALAGGISLAEPITLNGSGLADAGALRSVAGANVVSGAITLGSAARINADAGTLSLAALDGAGPASVDLTLGGAGAAALTGTIGAQIGQLLKDGAGRLSLSGANAYTGSSRVSAGTLATTAANRLPAGTVLTVDLAATFSLGGDQTLASIAGSGQVALAAGALSLGGDNSSASFDGMLSGSGSLVKLGSGRLSLGGASSGFDGAIRVDAGSLRASHGDALGSSAASTTVASGAALELIGGITLPVALVLNGTGIGNGGALRSISGANALTGGVTLGSAARINADAGSLLLDAALGSAAGADISFGGAGLVRLDQAINTGSGGLQKDGAGTLRLSGANRHGGATRVNGGTLHAASGQRQRAGQQRRDHHGGQWRHAGDCRRQHRRRAAQPGRQWPGRRGRAAGQRRSGRRRHHLERQQPDRQQRQPGIGRGHRRRRPGPGAGQNRHRHHHLHGGQQLQRRHHPAIGQPGDQRRQRQCRQRPAGGG